MTTDDKFENLLQPGKNCHRIVTAKRAACLIDGERYFRAAYTAMQRARRSIMIVGWDLHSELRLVRGEDRGAHPARLGRFLDALAKRRKGINIYLLSWDFAMIYAMEREFFPRYKFKWRTHERIHFCLDGEHPVGASQHQKIVVIDDAVAFAGGFDLSKWRWDTSGHRPEDGRRVDPDGKPYPPFHDVQMMVDGEAAKTLGDLVKDRWERACGALPAVNADIAVEDPWPPAVSPDFTDVRVAVARTLPAHKGRTEVREVERLYIESITAARRFIYIENQYLSSYRIGQALSRRLQEPDGPEVIVVLPEKTGGWLEQHTMDVLRGRLIEKLRAADRHQRLKIYYPRISRQPDISLMVHAKVMIIDDQFLRVGSSNLSNRSLGLDSECDLAISTTPSSPASVAIAAQRNRLVGEHLDAAPESVEKAVEASGSLIGAIETLRKGARTLMPLDGAVPVEVDQWVPEGELLDPEKPLAPDALFDYFVSPDQQPRAWRRAMTILSLVAGLLAMAALWRWSPAGQWLDMDSAMAAGRWLARQPASPLLILLAFVIGGMVSFPVTLMIIATAAIFGPWRGFIYALLGAEMSALILFAAGRWLGREAVRRFAGSLINRLSRKLTDNALPAVITLRIVPVAPFSVINIIAGASEIRWRDFALGSLIGLIPGTLAAAVVGDRLTEALRRADLGGLAMLLATVAAAILALLGLRRWLRGRHLAKHRRRGS